MKMVEGKLSFSEKALRVFKAKGFTEADIEEAKEAIRKDWPDLELRKLWINWIEKEFEVWR
jgi:hypothetical protein